MRSNPHLVDEVKAKGFALAPGAVESDQVQRLRSALGRHLAAPNDDLPPEREVDRWMVHNPLTLDPLFLEILTNEAIVDSMDLLLGTTSIVYAYTSSSMPAGGANFSTRIHVDSPRVIPGYLTNIGIILALDDFTEDNGATWFLPGSFEQADPPTEDEFFSLAERVYPVAGDLVVFNARTWHFGPPNRTASDRHALTVNACRSYMRQRFDYPRMLGYDRADELGPTLRRLLGYDVRVPVDLDEYYLPAGQRLYKANQG